MRDVYVVPVAARPEHSGIVGSQLYYTWERRGTGWTPGTTHTNTATRRIKWSGACTGAATVYIWAEGLDFTDATWSKPVHKSCRCRKCNYKLLRFKILALRTNTDIFYCLKPTAFYYTQHLAVINIEVSPAPSPPYITSPYKALQQSLAAKRLILQENYPLITVQSFPLLSYVS